MVLSIQGMCGKLPQYSFWFVLKKKKGKPRAALILTEKLCLIAELFIKE
jgi:hypothetical protein